MNNSVLFLSKNGRCSHQFSVFKLQDATGIADVSFDKQESYFDLDRKLQICKTCQTMSSYFNLSLYIEKHGFSWIYHKWCHGWCHGWLSTVTMLRKADFSSVNHGMIITCHPCFLTRVTQFSVVFGELVDWSL